MPHKTIMPPITKPFSKPMTLAFWEIILTDISRLDMCSVAGSSCICRPMVCSSILVVCPVELIPWDCLVMTSET